MDKLHALERRLARTQREVELLERLIEDRSRSLYMTESHLRESVEFLTSVLETMPNAVLVIDPRGRIQKVNTAARRLAGDDPVGLPWFERIELSEGSHSDAANLTPLIGQDAEAHFIPDRGDPIPILFAGSPIEHGEGNATQGIVCVCTDMREKKQLELELRHAQKMETVGQLAAGIAHELNTPIQFVGDNLSFLSDAFEDANRAIGEYRHLISKLDGHPHWSEELASIRAAEERADMDFLAKEVPSALRESMTGIERVSSIVVAMKEFAHPGDGDMSPMDINHGIHSTLTVARNEFKYVAEVELELGEIPEVVCHQGDINQVILNLVVNASHAIEAKHGSRGNRGRIAIRTRLEGPSVLIEVEDDGQGVPEDIRHRVFDPFFTTKGVGVGTGQGLAICRNIIEKKHGGKLTLISRPDKGALFRVLIPIQGREAA